jgi:hypothetical protein
MIMTVVGLSKNWPSKKPWPTSILAGAGRVEYDWEE